VTPRVDDIHKLIADIDYLLSGSGNRLSRMLSGHVQYDKDVLQQVRDFLLQLQETELSQQNPPQQSTQQPLSTLVNRFSQAENSPPSSQAYQLPQKQFSSLPEQLESEFADLLQPLRVELNDLLHQRVNLMQEIRQLEQKRLQNYSLTQQLFNQEQIISEFLQVLMSRLLPSLSPYVANSPNVTANDASGGRSHQQENVTTNPSGTYSLFGSSEQIERLVMLSRELDQRLLSLDGTVNLVFEALQRNIKAYHQSLSQALTRMHSQGLQGEQLMTSFLNNLTQHLQQQSFTFLTSPVRGVDESQSLDTQQVAHPKELDTTASFTDSSVGDVSSVEMLDTIISQLTSEQSSEQSSERLLVTTPDVNTNTFDTLSNTTNTVIDELQPKTVSSVSDEVDQLYASLFGVEDALNLQSTIISDPLENDLSTLDTTVSSLNIPEVTTESRDMFAQVKSQDSAEQSPVMTDDIPPGNRSFTPVSWEDLFLTEDTQPPSEVVNVIQDVVSVPVDSLPGSDDTITVLTDLLIDVSSDERSLEIPFLGDTPPTTSITVPGTISLHETFDREEDSSVDSFIPASLEEDLLSPQGHKVPIVPDIVLDPLQLEQLDLDLAHFNQQISVNLESTNNSLDFGNLVDQEKLLETEPRDKISPIENIEKVPDVLLPMEIGEVENQPDAAVNPDTLQLPEQNQLTDPPQANQPVVVIHSSDMAQQPTVKIDLRKIIEKKNIPTSPVSETISETTTTTDAPETVLSASSNLNNDSDSGIAAADSVWYLGIDLGTTGISVALLNRSTSVIHPIYWSTENQPSKTPVSRSFRLPAEVYLPVASVLQSGESGEHDISPPGVTQDPTATPLGTTPQSAQNFHSAELKPYLQVAVPYKNKKQKWEPVLQLNEFSSGPLIWVVRSLAKLLLTLKSEQVTTTPALIAHADGIDQANFATIINEISGVICTCPSDWSEQYRFNLREAILIGQLVQHPQQIFFLEEAIATLLPELDTVNSPPVQLQDHKGLRPLRSSEQQLLGNTLSINIGARVTEMALVNLPDNTEGLTHQDFMLHSFNYAGKGIEQDIICQLLLPPKSRQSRLEVVQDQDQNQDNPVTTNPHTWQWQPTIPGLDQMRWASLELETLELPRVGEPDIPVRIRLQQRLESSLLGHALLDAALALKIILQHQETFTLELADQQWVLQRRDLESQIFVPFVRRLNRELNKLLVAWGTPTEAIDRAILTGGLASVGTINRWLRQKVPNAKIIQDAYLDETGTPMCSRVAYGLAVLPLHPQILEVSQHQYTDYFLLSELLKILPDRTLSFGEVLHLFENRGVHTRNCQQRLLAFLEGEIPSGLIPSSLDTNWLTHSSRDNPDYKLINGTPFFEKLGNLTYRPNWQKLMPLRYYMDSIKTSAIQSLEEPYIVNFIQDTQAKKPQ